MSTGIAKGYADVHQNRFNESIKYLKKFVKPGAKILEVGEATEFTEMLKEFGEVTNTDTDIRLSLKPGKYDVIISTEILEHLKDLEPSELDFSQLSTWNYTGVKSFLELCKKALKKDGIIFISTPNVSTYKCIANLLYGEAPFMYHPHVREMSEKELDSVFSDCGYTVKDKTFIDVWNSHGVSDWFKKSVDELAKKAGSKYTHREDNIFLILKTK